MINFFSNIFGYVLNWIYMIVQNYGVAIILFSILIKILMIPMSISQQKTLRKNEKLQKEIKVLQVKHNGNQEKINHELMEIYKREKISPFSGCFSIIIQLILLLAMFYLVRSPLTYMKKIDKSVIEEQENKIKTEYGEDSISKAYPEIDIIKYSNNSEENNQLKINMNFWGLDLNKIPQQNVSEVKVYIIPVLYVISSIISLKINSNNIKNNKKENIETKGNELIKPEKAKEMSQEELSAQMNKNMSLMMPFLSFSVSLVAPLGLALYWLVNNIIMIIERLILNKVFPKEEEENG